MPNESTIKKLEKELKKWTEGFLKRKNIWALKNLNVQKLAYRLASTQSNLSIFKESVNGPF